MDIFARRYDTHEPILLKTEGRLISYCEPIDEGQGVDSSQVPPNRFIAPGLVDIQVNGYGGREFSSPELTTSDVRKIASEMANQGTTRFCPTLTTQSEEVMLHGLRTIVAACREDAWTDRRILGIHVEGPFISTHDGPRGAHPAQFCRPPSWELFQRFQEAADGKIRIVTLSPEYDESLAFIERAVAAGVVAAIGHTDASPERIHDAVRAGASLSTHLGNGCAVNMHRHRNCLWSQLSHDELMTSIIADGHHLPGYMVKCISRVKAASRCILVSDMSGWAGMPPGVYDTSLGGIEILPDGRIVVAGQRELLAAASSSLFSNASRFAVAAEVAMREAIDAACANPLRLMNTCASRMRAEEPADLVLFETSMDEPEEEGEASAGWRMVAAVCDGRYR